MEKSYINKLNNKKKTAEYSAVFREILPPTRLASLRGGSFLFEDQPLKVEFSTTKIGSTWAISRTL